MFGRMARWVIVREEKRVEQRERIILGEEKRAWEEGRKKVGGGWKAWQRKWSLRNF